MIEETRLCARLLRRQGAHRLGGRGPRRAGNGVMSFKWIRNRRPKLPKQRVAGPPAGRQVRVPFPAPKRTCNWGGWANAQPLAFATRRPTDSQAESLRSSAGFGGPGLPPAALPDTDGVLAPHNRSALRRLSLSKGTSSPMAGSRPAGHLQHGAAEQVRRFLILVTAPVSRTTPIAP